MKKPLRGIKARNFWHAFLVGIIATERKKKKQTYSIISDKRKRTSKPIIYACTHIGYDDVSIIYEVIKRPAYAFLGDPKSLYRSLEGLLLFLNGCISIELQCKSDRMVAKETAKELLRNGGNLLIFPEGAWNITENLPVMKLFPGAVSIAMATGSEIIPVAIEQYGKEFILNIGENIDFSKRETISEKHAVDELRDIMCTLKWGIYEYRKMRKREKLTEDYWKNFVENVWGEQSDEMVTLEEIHRGRYRDKDICEAQEAFNFYKQLSPSRNNAFLWRDRQKYMNGGL